MAASAFAEIRWLTPDEGGRLAPAHGQPYSTVARFEAQSEEDWLEEAWSLVLDLDEGLTEALTQRASIRFLADESKAPAHWLRSGSRFALFEGSRKVAQGVVL